MTSAEQALAAAYRADWGRLLALLLARTRRLDLVEDGLAEAFAQGAARWPVHGIPANPSGWLYTVASRQIIDAIRTEEVAARKAPLVAVRPGWAAPTDAVWDEGLPDDRLELIVLCCHPALPLAARSALALRLVMGTPTEQIARLFLVPTPTMAARLTRAKRKIVQAGIPLGVPMDVALASRLDDVCRTVYLAFTAGYTPGSGPELLRADLAGEAVRLASILHALTPTAPQAGALLALLTLQHSRRDARVSQGTLVTLAAQDRDAWHQEEIQVGLAVLAQVPRAEGYAQELLLQALIAAEHARAPSAAQTDWPRIATRYAELEAMTGSPWVRLNRAVALAEADSPRAGLALLDGLSEQLVDQHRFWAVHADLSARTGATDAARASYARAITLCHNDVECRHLRSRAADLPR